jgi:hypothetical protein
MNRAQRRAQGLPKISPEVRQHMTQDFTDRISWTAAAVLLQRVVSDPAFGSLDNDLKGGIARFLERHPAPIKLDEPS